MVVLKVLCSLSRRRPVINNMPQGLVLGPVLFKILVGKMNSVTEYTLSIFADDTKLCNMVGTLEGRDAVHRDLDRLERWACANLMKFNKPHCKVMHLIQGNLKHQYSLENEWIESSLAEKALGYWLVKKST